MKVEVDELGVTVSTLRAMSHAAADGWQALDAVNDVLRGSWVGNHARSFDDDYLALVVRAKALLALLEEKPNKLLFALDSFIKQDRGAEI